MSMRLLKNFRKMTNQKYPKSAMRLSVRLKFIWMFHYPGFPNQTQKLNQYYFFLERVIRKI